MIFGGSAVVLGVAGGIRYWWARHDRVPFLYCFRDGVILHPKVGEPRVYRWADLRLSFESVTALDQTGTHAHLTARDQSLHMVFGDAFRREQQRLRELMGA